MTPVKIILSLFLLYISYHLISALLLSGHRRERILRIVNLFPVVNLSEIRARARIAGSIIICFFLLFLPHVLREFFAFILHFMLNSFAAKVKLLFRWINLLFSFVVLFFAYFLLMPLTILIRLPLRFRFPGAGKGCSPPGGEKVGFDNIFRMF
ncbi:MAG: hypothetical protein DRP85_04310 [Candidatus Makaraimicrobium thalassicum]|nr:MAG: hypothetical protein DRP85_04310 [Candidatus Omnitrophota bacterium]